MTQDRAVLDLLYQEQVRQEETISLIASENLAPKAVREVVGSVFANKYAEGYPKKRYYGGCEHHDELENLAMGRAKKLFGAEHANVQAHCGSAANMAAFFALAQPGDRILAMDLDHGGHLTHGARVNFSGKWFSIESYGVDPETQLLNYEKINQQAEIFKPKIIIAGASAYPRKINFERLRQIADNTGAYLLVDMAHIAGLVAAGLHSSPIKWADIVTSTTHKSLRGPRGGLILCREKYSKQVDSWVFPGLQGGPFMHEIAGKAVCFGLALDSKFREYQEQVVKNSCRLGQMLQEKGFSLISGGTDNHLVLVNLAHNNLTGKEAEARLQEIGIVVNKNKIPFDKLSAKITSGIRLGTPLVSSRGMKEREIDEIALLIFDCLIKNKSANILRDQVRALAKKFWDPQF